jgi:hypothetical protein
LATFASVFIHSFLSIPRSNTSCVWL